MKMVYICYRDQAVSGYPRLTSVLPQWINSSLNDVTGIDSEDKENILPTLKSCIFFLVPVIQEHYATTANKAKANTIGSISPGCGNSLQKPLNDPAT